jgi:hypothetical protein
MTRLRVTDGECLAVAASAIAVQLWIGDWLAPVSLVALWIGYKLLVSGNGILALFLAFVFQWVQVTAGVFYVGVTGRTLKTALESDYRPMVLIGLGCIVSLAIGLRVGMSFVNIGDWHADERPRLQLSRTAIVVSYAVVLVAQGSILQLGASYPSLRQILVTVTVLRLGLLFLILRRMCRPFRPVPFMALIGLEVALGMTGFYQGFREPMVVAFVALAETFDRRKTQHWMTVGILVAGLLAISVLWMGIRGSYREDLQQLDALTTESARFDRVHQLSADWFRQDPSQMLNTVDAMVDRVWAVYYPALALARVPSVIDYAGGSILRAALVHLTMPRVLFPDKPELPSDSDMVRKYSGVLVAGREENTSIAFGYAAESYVDFGLPLMFLPVLLFGLAMGVVYHAFLRAIWSGEIAASVVTVVFWLSLYLFERSWANLLGYSAALIVYLGLPMVLLDRLIIVRWFRDRGRVLPTGDGFPADDGLEAAGWPREHVWPR